jgi:hypothetical protein
MLSASIRVICGDLIRCVNQWVVYGLDDLIKGRIQNEKPPSRVRGGRVGIPNSEFKNQSVTSSTGAEVGIVS